MTGWQTCNKWSINPGSLCVLQTSRRRSRCASASCARTSRPCATTSWSDSPPTPTASATSWPSCPRSERPPDTCCTARWSTSPSCSTPRPLAGQPGDLHPQPGDLHPLPAPLLGHWTARCGQPWTRLALKNERTKEWCYHWIGATEKAGVNVKECLLSRWNSSSCSTSSKSVVLQEVKWDWVALELFKLLWWWLLTCLSLRKKTERISTVLLVLLITECYVKFWDFLSVFVSTVEGQKTQNRWKLRKLNKFWSDIYFWWVFIVFVVLQRC